MGEVSLKSQEKYVKKEGLCINPTKQSTETKPQTQGISSLTETGKKERKKCRVTQSMCCTGHVRLRPTNCCNSPFRMAPNHRTITKQGTHLSSPSMCQETPGKSQEASKRRTRQKPETQTVALDHDTHDIQLQIPHSSSTTFISHI